MALWCHSSWETAWAQLVKKSCLITSENEDFFFPKKKKKKHKLTAVQFPCLAAGLAAGKEGQMQKACLCIPVPPDLAWKSVKVIKGQAAILCLHVLLG